MKRGYKRVFKSKSVKSVLIVLIVALAFGFPTTSFAAKDFPDVKKGSDHYDSIHWLVEHGIQGYEDGTFGKHDALTRGQAAVMFTKVLNLKKPAAKEVENYFNDIPANHDYAQQIAAVAKAGIFSGNQDDDFLDGNELTREQMATTIVNAYKLESGQPSVSINLDNVTSDHENNVQTIADLKITSQVKNFTPLNSITRGQFATFLYESDQVDIGEAPGVTKNYVSRSYNYNFSTALNKQMKLNPLPQTDARGSWYDASKSFTQYYLNPKNFDRNSHEYYQFLLLSGSSQVSASQLNSKVLKGKGVLSGHAADFKKASATHDVNEIYLVSHALLETGNGGSALAKGVKVGKNKAGKPVRVTSGNKKSLHSIKTTYNFFGIGAIDSCALSCGSERAYSEGWFTPKKAIVGGAQFISRDYVSKGQDTIYKMRWNPDAPATHQYASDAGWAVKQTKRIKDIYDLLQDDNVVMNFEVPSYNKQPAAKAKPKGANVFNANTNHYAAGKSGKVVKTNSLNFRTGPTTGFKSIKALKKGTNVKIIGTNNSWYKIKVGSQQGWVSSNYINLNGARSIQSFDLAPDDINEDVTSEKEDLMAKQTNPDRVIANVVTDRASVYEEANETSNVIVGGLSAEATVEIIAEQEGWYNVIVDDKEGFMPSESLQVVNVKTVKANTVSFDEPDGEKVETLLEHDTVIIVPTENLELTQVGEWYEVYHHGQMVWIHADQIN